MITNKTLTLLPWYDTVEKQWHRIYGKEFSTCPVICPTNRMIPWEIKRDPLPDLLTDLILVDMCNGESQRSIFADLEAGQITYNTLGGYDYIQYLSSEDLSNALPCGYFYLIATDGVNTFYSEVFQVVNFTDNSYDIIMVSDTEELTYNGSELIIG